MEAVFGKPSYWMMVWRMDMAKLTPVVSKPVSRYVLEDLKPTWSNLYLQMMSINSYGD
jgi:hypothetical protein